MLKFILFLLVAVNNWEIDDETFIKFYGNLKFDCNVNADDIEFVPRTQLSQHSYNYDVVPETQMNVWAIEHKPKKEVYVDKELVVCIPDEERRSDVGHVNEEEPCVDRSTKRMKELAIGKHPSLKCCHYGVPCDVIVCRN